MTAPTSPSPAPSEPNSSGSTSPPSTWAPLRQPVFRALWTASAFSSVGTWMHDVGAAWLMTSLAPNSPFWVALMQAAGSLPFFLLALPAGAISDIVDRRKMLLITQSWMCLMAITLGVLTLTNQMTPALLLGLTFALSLGTSMNLPAWQATMPELVSKQELPAAATLNGLVINLARSIGPAIAGMVIAAAGGNPGIVFLLNATSFVIVISTVYRWRRTPQVRDLPAERFVGAIQAGMRYARYAPQLQTVMVRSGAYILFASALFALLPTLGRRELGLDALGYGVLLGFWGIGGLAGAFILPKVRQRFSTDRVVAGGTLLLSFTMLVLAQVRIFPVVCGVMLLVGIASISVMVSLNATAQTVVPLWVRARALAINLLLFQGCMTVGSLLWGAVAQRASVNVALTAAAIGLMGTVMLSARFCLQCAEKMDLSASLHWDQPFHVFEPCPNDGPVMITIEYRIAPDYAPDFRKAMADLSHIRRRDGAIHWGLFQDLGDPGRFVESVIVESWVEHRRQYERVTEADRAVEARAWAFHVADKPPQISEMIYAR
jgi:MFS family permease/quinol monooxygenase YgiN